jgi:MFS family permease
MTLDTQDRSLIPLLIVSFIGTLGYSIVLPSLVYVVQRVGGNEFMFGVIGASYSAFQLIGSPLLGKLSDRFGRKRLLLVSEAGSVVGWILFLIALAIPVTAITTFSVGVAGLATLTIPLVLVLIARAADGITAGDVSVANAYVADIVPPEGRKRAFGRMGMAANLGFVVGPVTAGLLADTALGLSLPILLALATSVLAVVLTIWLLPESTRAKRRAGNVSAKLSLRDALAMSGIPLLLTIYFVFYFAFSLFVAAIPLYAVELLRWSPTETGIFFTVLSIVIVVTEGPILTLLNKRVSAEVLVTIGSFIIVLSYLALLVPSPLLAYSCAVLYALGNGLMWPSFLSLLADRAGEEHQGYIQGIGNSVGSLASIIGLLLGGLLFRPLGQQIFWLPAVLVLAVALMSFGLSSGRRGAELDQHAVR